MKTFSNLYSPKMLIGLLTACLVGVAASVGIIYLCSSEMDKLRLERQTLAADFERLSEIRSAVGRGDVALADADAWLENWERLIPREMDFESFYSDLSRLSERHGIEVDRIQPSETEVRGRHLTMGISIGAESSFRTFYEFVRDIEALPRLATVEQLDIRAVDGDDRCRFELTLNIYALSSEGANNG